MSKIYNFIKVFFYQNSFYEVLFVKGIFFGKLFAGLLYNLAIACIISSHITTEASIILAKYKQFSQLEVLEL